MIDLLEGMRVVELASYIMGPIAGRVLAEWGAEVIKIEPMLRDTWNPADGDGDMIRGAGMARAIVNGDPCVWEFVNGSKKSVCNNNFGNRTVEIFSICFSVSGRNSGSSRFEFYGRI